MDTPALVPFKTIILSYLNARGDYSTDDYKRMYQIALEGYRELNIHHTRTFKSAYLTVNEVGIVKLPSDFIEYIRIGLVDNGMVWTLSKNNNLKFTEKGACYIDVADPQLNTDLTKNSFNYSSGGGVNVGEYRIDERQRTIIFRGQMTGREIILEYISTGIGMSEDTFVPVELLPVIRDYIHWTMLKYDREAPQVQKDDAQRNYSNSLVKYLRLKLTPSLDEVLDAIRSGYSQTAKR